jgi:hypothetical protein
MFFFLSFLFLLQNQITRGQNMSCPGEGNGTNGRGEVTGKGGRREKCVHIYVNAKMTPVETIPGIGKGGIKENIRGGEFKYNIFDTL